MGLLYPFPATAEETDFIQLQVNPPRSVTLKTYGLPYIFWLYAFASLTVVFFLWLAVNDSLAKLVSMGGNVDRVLVHSLQTLLVCVPLVTVGFFFYEKRLIRRGDQLTIQGRILGIPFQQRVVTLAKSEAFVIKHYLDAPNMARLKAGADAQGFQNKGYFTLWARTLEGREVQLDRHSRKADLNGVMTLLELGA